MKNLATMETESSRTFLNSEESLEKKYQVSRGLLYRRTNKVKDLVECVITDETGRSIRLEKVHTEWHDFIEERLDNDYIRIGILAPWGTGKTVNIALGFVLHLIQVNPNLRIKIVCNSDMNAEARVTTIQRYITQSEEYHFATDNKVKTDRLEKCTAHEFFLARDSMSIDPSVQAKGINTGGTSGRADVLLYDDPL